MLNLWTVWSIPAPVVVPIFAGVWCIGLFFLMRQGYERVREIEPEQAHRIQRVDGWAGVVAGPLMGMAVWWVFGATPAAVASLMVSLFLWVLAVIDARTGYLPDLLTLSLVWLGLLANLHTGFAALQEAVLGAVAGYLFLWLIAMAFVWSTGRHGLGRGDCKLLAALGAWFGLAALPFILLLASATGLCVALVWRLTGKLQAGQSFSFGPFLAASGVFYLFWAYC
ncbi:prepilin peptidase [Orrella marina]|uniref:Prepilin peptidase n=1 Tax=Orrella marina TaxID=2163011 RepID=A0A2R4XKS1_9BURK|nr:A24 family peptidase [Orrella marina]AWB34397.1 prepilin peptidase [Orrella marina]